MTALRHAWGPNWWFRFWGDLFPSGRTAVPAAVEFRTSMGPLGAGTIIVARAFDAFGFRVTDKMFLGVDATFSPRLEELLGKAAASLGVERPV